MAGRDVNININGKDNFSQAANAAGRSATNLKSTLGSIGNFNVGSVGGLGSLFSVAGVGALAAGSVKLAAGYEQTNVAFKTMLKSGTAAKDLLAGISKFAAETPFQFTELTDAGKKLLAFGVAANDIVPTLRRIGDISSGIGAPIGEIAELYGKARVQGRLFAEDINQLTGRGIPIIQELAKQFGVADSEVRKLVESGQIGFKNLEQAFVSMTTGGGQFTGMMVEQSKTLVGQWSSLKDLIEQAGRELGTTFIPKLKEAVEGMNALFGGPANGGGGNFVKPGGQAGRAFDLQQSIDADKAKLASMTATANSPFMKMMAMVDPVGAQTMAMGRDAVARRIRENEGKIGAVQGRIAGDKLIDAIQLNELNSASPFAQRGLGMLNRLPGLAGSAFDAVSGGVSGGVTGIMGAVQRQREQDVLRKIDEARAGAFPNNKGKLDHELAMTRTAAFESRFRINAPGNNDAENKANADRLNAEKEAAKKAQEQRERQLRVMENILRKGVILKKSDFR